MRTHEKPQAKAHTHLVAFQGSCISRVSKSFSPLTHTHTLLDPLCLSLYEDTFTQNQYLLMSRSLPTLVCREREAHTGRERERERNGSPG